MPARRSACTFRIKEKAPHKDGRFKSPTKLGWVYTSKHRSRDRSRKIATVAFGCKYGTETRRGKNASIVEESLLANPELTLLLVSHHLPPERRAQLDRVYDLEPVSAGRSA